MLQLFNHEKALGILVHQLHDFTGAENYCFHVKTALSPSSPTGSQLSSAKSDHSDDHSRRQAVQDLFAHLLQVYLKLEDCEHRQKRVLNLLERHATDVDLAETLDILPRDWSIPMLASYLQKSLVETGHAYRTTKMLAAVARAEHSRTKAEYIRVVHQCGALPLTEQTAVCLWCKKALRPDSPFGVVYRRKRERSPLMTTPFHLNCMKQMEEAAGSAKQQTQSVQNSSGS